ncbi:MAG: DUF3276 family protein [Bacteroidetes bacterium]|nr:DUF3276 family protein [Bacteroidota bacterium]
MEKKGTNDKFEGFFSKRLKAGIRTYFFDVKGGREGAYFLSISESKKRRDGEGYESHKIFLYPEDFKKFAESLQEALDYVKTELMPQFDFEAGRPEQERTSNHSSPGNNKPLASMPPVTEKKSLIDHDKSEVNSSTPPPITDDEQIDWK